jgi:NAD(P)-dependent dehydrogenase (short-subunit alcohol dehydrogenase family)
MSADRPRVAVITGGGRGLGAAMALGLAQAGYRVVITAAQERTEIDAVAAQAQSDQIIPVIADVTREEDCERVVDTALTRFGRLDILINNAGRGMKYVSDRFMIDTNVNGPFFMARAAVRSMLRNRWGRIINISMNRDTMRRAGFSPYGPSKAAVESETIIWSQDLAGTGVTVNALLPGGATLTGMIPPGFPDHLRTALLDPAIMVPPLLWLVSSAADNITGKRVIANRWPSGVDQPAAPEVALEDAG